MPFIPSVFKIRLSFLGHLTLIHLWCVGADAAAADSRDRLWFLAQLRAIGASGAAALFAISSPSAPPLALGLHAMRPGSATPVWLAPGDFLRDVVDRGAFRGIPVPGRAAAVAGGVDLEPRRRPALTSLAFGAVHLWFRGFPNWRWALIAGALGWFCGRARNQAGEHPRRHGHARAGDRDLDGLFRLRSRQTQILATDEHR